jgi:hypothetical protein
LALRHRTRRPARYLAALHGRANRVTIEANRYRARADFEMIAHAGHCARCGCSCPPGYAAFHHETLTRRGHLPGLHPGKKLPMPTPPPYDPAIDWTRYEAELREAFDAGDVIAEHDRPPMWMRVAGPALLAAMIVLSATGSVLVSLPH